MNVTVGRTSSSKNNGPLAVLLAGLTLVGFLAGIGIWQSLDSETSSPAAPAVSAPSAGLPRAADLVSPTYIYVVDSPEQASQLYQAMFEAQAYFGDSSTINDDFHVIDISTAAGQEEYNLLNAELAEQQATNAAFDASLVQFIDLTATAEVAPNGGAEVPVKAEAAQIPTYFYVVESQEQAEQVQQLESVRSMELMEAGLASEPHETVIVDVSTLEGQQLYQTVNGGLFEMWDNPEFDQSLVQIIDLR